MKNIVCNHCGHYLELDELFFSNITPYFPKHDVAELKSHLNEIVISRLKCSKCGSKDIHIAEQELSAPLVEPKTDIQRSAVDWDYGSDDEMKPWNSSQLRSGETSIDKMRKNRRKK